jgi:hypothetical protein
MSSSCSCIVRGSISRPFDSGMLGDQLLNFNLSRSRRILSRFVAVERGRGEFNIWSEMFANLVHHIVRPGETLSSIQHENRVGGKGANQAVAIARAGGDARFYGTTGRDGDWIQKKMHEYEVDIRGLVMTDVSWYLPSYIVRDDIETYLVGM